MNQVTLTVTDNYVYDPNVIPFLDMEYLMTITDNTVYDNTSGKYMRTVFNFSQFIVTKPAGEIVTYGNTSLPSDKYVDPPSLLPLPIEIYKPSIGIYSITLVCVPDAVSGNSYGAGEFVIIGGVLYQFTATTGYTGSLTNLVTATVSQLIGTVYSSTVTFASSIAFMKCIKKKLLNLSCAVIQDMNYNCCSDQDYLDLILLMSIGVIEDSTIFFDEITPTNIQDYNYIFNYARTVCDCENSC
jgi:hypothetical protein